MEINTVTILTKSESKLVSITLEDAQSRPILLTWSHIQKILRKITLVELFEVVPESKSSIELSNERHFWSRYAIENKISLHNLYKIEQDYVVAFHSFIIDEDGQVFSRVS